MFPNFSYLAHYFIGTEPDNVLANIGTYGFFLALGIYLATVLFKKELKRKEKQGVFGDYEINDQTGYKGKFTSELMNGHTLFAVIGGLMGAKFLPMLENIPKLLESPKATFYEAGMAAYGGLIFGSLASYVYWKKNKISFPIILDTIGPIFFLSYCLARVGCHLSGDGCWGIAASQKPSWWFLPDWMWSFSFPHNIGKEGVLMDACTFRYNKVLDVPVIPTSFYEMLITFILFCGLWSLRKKSFPTGLMFGIYLLLNGFERFFIEFIRVNQKHHFLGFSLSQAQIIALFSMLAGTILCAVVLFNQRKNTVSY